MFTSKNLSHYELAQNATIAKLERKIKQSNKIKISLGLCNEFTVSNLSF